MSDERKNNREDPHAPCEGKPSADSMGGMMKHCAEMMPAMMAMCGTRKDEGEDSGADPRPDG